MVSVASSVWVVVVLVVMPNPHQFSLFITVFDPVGGAYRIRRAVQFRLAVEYEVPNFEEPRSDKFICALLLSARPDVVKIYLCGASD